MPRRGNRDCGARPRGWRDGHRQRSRRRRTAQPAQTACTSGRRISARSRFERSRGDDVVVGLSTHTAEQIAAAAEAPIDYLAIGPVFATATKETGYEAVGLDACSRGCRRRVAASAPRRRDRRHHARRAHSVIAAGAAAVAVIGDLLAIGDPGSARPRSISSASADGIIRAV